MKKWFLRHWTPGNEEQWLLWDRKPMQWAVALLQLTPWEFPGPDTGSKTQEISGKLRVLRRQSWKSGKTKVARVYRSQNWRGKGWGKIFSGDLSRVPLEYSAGYLPAHKCKKTKAGENKTTTTKTPERISGNSAWYSQGAINRAYLPAKLENLIIHRHLGRILRRDLSE